MTKIYTATEIKQKNEHHAAELQKLVENWREETIKELMNMVGTKHDQDKPMITLVRPEFIEGVAAAMTFGAKKYGRYNYREGIEYSRLLDAMIRHALKWARGEEIDEDSGLNHLLLVASNANMLFDLMQNNLGTDDRIKKSMYQIKKKLLKGIDEQ